MFIKLIPYKLRENNFRNYVRLTLATSPLNSLTLQKFIAKSVINEISDSNKRRDSYLKIIFEEIENWLMKDDINRRNKVIPIIENIYEELDSFFGSTYHYNNYSSLKSYVEIIKIYSQLRYNHKKANLWFVHGRVLNSLKNQKSYYDRFSARPNHEVIAKRKYFSFLIEGINRNSVITIIPFYDTVGDITKPKTLDTESIDYKYHIDGRSKFKIPDIILELLVRYDAGSFLLFNYDDAENKEEYYHIRNDNGYNSIKSICEGNVLKECYMTKGDLVFINNQNQAYLQIQSIPAPIIQLYQINKYLKKKIKKSKID